MTEEVYWHGRVERIHQISVDNLYLIEETDKKTQLASSIYANYSIGFVPTVLHTGKRYLSVSDVV